MKNSCFFAVELLESSLGDAPPSPAASEAVKCVAQD